jgi:hypothetical protein
MSEHFWGSNKGFEILANSVQNPLGMTWMVYSGVSSNLGIKWFQLSVSLLTLFAT